MSLLALTVVIASTFMQAAWNLMARHGRAESHFMRRLLLSTCAIWLAPALVAEFMQGPLDTRLLTLVAVSGVCSGIYFRSLAKGYESSDFTIVYPMVRALPVLLLAACDLLRGSVPSAAGWTGILLVVVGCFLVPLRAWRDFHPRAYMQPVVVWVLIGALATMGYSMIDKVASDHVRETGAVGATMVITILRYTYYYIVVATITNEVLSRFGRAKPAPARPAALRYPIIAGILNYLSYAMIVWVYQTTAQVSYVVAFRQFSIVIGVIAAFVIFHEQGKFVRITATLLITAGLLIIGLWGN
ncbi:MAG: hypothetical protein CMJ18_06180 [Phycisphaeraceae bacterium]|nr:hypothetical protein [Phycisphaeraceae bacterium]